MRGGLKVSHFAFQETELLDLSLVKDARCGKHAKAPKVGNMEPVPVPAATLILYLCQDIN